VTRELASPAVPSFLEVASAGKVEVKLETTPPTATPALVANASATPPSAETSAGRIAALLDAAPPPEEIVLHIQRGNDKQHVFRLYVDGQILEQHFLASPPERLIDRGSGADVITQARATTALSIEVRRVLARLRECAARHKDPWLCIDELKSTGIVWELLPIEVDEPPLGVLFNVWRRETLLIGADPLEACDWVRRSVSGAILSYCAPDVRSEWSPHHHVLAPSDFASLRAALRDGGHSAALIYLYCHCHQGKSTMRTILGEYGVAEQVVDASYLLGLKCKLLTESQPVVFLNACGSASRSADDAYLPGTHTSFASLFLKRGAVGVIATLVPVQTRLAARLGERIIALAHERAEGRRLRSVPEILRVLRHEIYETYKDVDLVDDPDAADHYCHAFLYIYLGAPRAHLEFG